MGGGWSPPRPSRFTTSKETRYPLYRRLGGLLGQSGRVRNISPPPGFDPRNVQPVASSYTDWAIPAAKIYVTYNKNILIKIGNIYIKAIHNSGQRLAIFSTFIKNELLIYCITLWTRAHRFSKVLRRSRSALPGKGLKDVFSLQISPRET